MDRGNKTIAWDEIKIMQTMVNKNSAGERKSNLRPLLEMEASYYAAIGKYNEAKDIYKNKGVFTIEETANAIKRIEYEQAFKSR